jgi:FAD/FMN-containing dehydrogenase
MLPVLKRLDGTVVDKGLVESFKHAFGGQSLLPGDEAYDSARKIWNARIDRYPGLIAQCSSTKDVVDAVKFARENDLLVAVRAGGHSIAGRSLCDDGIVIDLSLMKGVSVDPRSRTVRVQPGVLLEEADRKAHEHGLAVPAGVMSKVGMIGSTLGGGVGWLARKYGLACDNLLACEVVTADGQVLMADPRINPDLFWGLRGGGGNFGIVTSAQFKAYPVSSVLGGIVAFTRDNAQSVLRFYRDFMASAPEDLTAYAALMSMPDGTPMVAILACYCGEVAEGERLLEPLRTIAPAMFDTIQVMPFPVMQKLADASNPDGIHNHWRSTFLRELSDETINVIIEHADHSFSPLSFVILQIFDGAINKVGPADTAFPHRRAGFSVGIEAKWVDPMESAPNVAWSQTFSDALKPYSSGTSLVNFLGDEGSDVIRAAFGSNYERMVDLKTKYDPTNFFRLNQNVEPRRSPAHSGIVDPS